MVFPELLGSAMVEELCDKVRYINICTILCIYINTYTYTYLALERDGGGVVRADARGAVRRDVYVYMYMYIYICICVYVYVYLYM